MKDEEVAAVREETSVVILIWQNHFKFPPSKSTFLLQLYHNSIEATRSQSKPFCSPGGLKAVTPEVCAEQLWLHLISATGRPPTKHPDVQDDHCFCDKIFLFPFFPPTCKAEVFEQIFVKFHIHIHTMKKWKLLKSSARSQLTDTLLFFILGQIAEVTIRKKMLNILWYFTTIKRGRLNVVLYLTLLLLAWYCRYLWSGLSPHSN